MDRKIARAYCIPACLTVVGLAVVGSMALAQPATKDKPKTPDAHQPAGGQPEFQLPPGWTKEDMQACEDAAKKGPQHEELAKGVGTWTGTNQMWMAPGAPPVTSPCTQTVVSLMDGRYIRAELSGDFGGMPFKGEGTVGYDNVSKKYVGTWFDNMGTGIMYGTGEASKDGKTITWTYKMNCPIQKKEVTMREVESHPTPSTMTLDMYQPDPKTGKEYHSMHIDFSKK